ncbi:hypothetical protein [Spirulina subsalsa]|uniref:hypothetical protein n=1 Tax=Spirulina subsalsa TaxID=54311 RepID=UPI00223705FF|nr:hypothetical protein [Spirulina subsalsa]
MKIAHSIQLYFTCNLHSNENYGVLSNVQGDREASRNENREASRNENREASRNENREASRNENREASRNENREASRNENHTNRHGGSNRPAFATFSVTRFTASPSPQPTRTVCGCHV